MMSLKTDGLKWAEVELRKLIFEELGECHPAYNELSNLLTDLKRKIRDSEEMDRDKSRHRCN